MSDIKTQPEFRIVKTLDHGEILEWMRALRLKAYVPGSGYKVSAVFAMKRENDYVLAGGVNVECLDHRLSSHGETSALAMLCTAFGKKTTIAQGWTLGAPQGMTEPDADDLLADAYGFSCGACRQHINDFADETNIPLHSFNINGGCDSKLLSYLLPDSFSFGNYDPEAQAMRLAAIQEKDTSDLEQIFQRVVRYEAQEPRDIFKWMSSLKSIDYASGVDQSVVLRLDNGAYVAGVKVENAAYVGTSAMVSALANAVTTFGDIQVKEVYILSRSKRSADNDVVTPPTFSALQSLGEFIQSPASQISVTMFTANGQLITGTLEDIRSLPNSFLHPAYCLKDGQLVL